MAVKPIRLFGDPVLRTQADPVKDFDKELRNLVKDLTDTMIDAPGARLVRSSRSSRDSSPICLAGFGASFGPPSTLNVLTFTSVP